MTTALTEPLDTEPDGALRLCGNDRSADTARQAEEIEKLCFSDPWSLSALEACFAAADNVVVITARLGEKLVGYAAANHAADMADILNIAVLPEKRRLGIGRALMEELLEGLKQKGVGTVYLEVRRSNNAARRLYASLGFTGCGVREKYYSAPREDALVCRLTL